MNKNVMWMALLLASSSSVAMAQINLDFLYSGGTGNRVQADDGDSITLDFAIGGTGIVSLDANHVDVGDPTDPQEYLDAINSWDSANVGSVEFSALFGTSFQLTIFADSVNGTENLSLDDSRDNGAGSMGIGGQNSSRIDGQGNGIREILHVARTGGTAQIQLLDFSWHGQSGSMDIYDTRLIAGAVDNDFANLGNGTNLGTEDVSGLGYFIGSGANDLTFRVPDDDPNDSTVSSHGLGLQGLTLRVVPEPSTFGLLAAFGTALMVRRRRS